MHGYRAEPHANYRPAVVSRVDDVLFQLIAR
jgi:hypothetical protein